MSATRDNNPASRRKFRLIGIVIGLVSLVLLLAGYIRVKPVLTQYALMNAVQADDVVAARAAIHHGAAVNANVLDDETKALTDALTGLRWGDDATNSVLNVAAELGHTDTVQFLVSQGADVNRMHKYYTPLMDAIFAKDIDSVRCLVAHGANVNAVTGDDNTPVLDLAYHQPEIRRILVAAGAHE
jgi:ankyrin repeat protein